ncbi:MAG: hypothetical protein L0H73_00625 [Nitrococcus sp.]|nr:hypothetical protein [Nitrococcus sp.]
MSVSEISSPKRLSVTLDPGLVLERLILKRLAVLQRKRGQDWLRSLLVQGFLAEGRWLRSAESDGGKSREPHVPAIPKTPYAGWLEGSRANDRTDHELRSQPAEAPMAALQTSAGSKPFAHLRKVIG